MPRTGRGGARQGTPGTAYSNRTDLQGQKVPIMTAPSPQYGTAIAQQRAQQAMPIAAAPSVPPPTQPTPPAPAPAPPTPLDSPTQRPGEHVMTGAPIGPGPGPEALGPLAQPPQTGYANAQQQVADLAQRDPNNQALAYLAAKMQVRF